MKGSNNKHLSLIYERLTDPLVLKVCRAIFSNNVEMISKFDKEQVADIGLIKIISENDVRIANAIYFSLISKAVTSTLEGFTALCIMKPDYLLPTGHLNFGKLMQIFEEYYTQNKDMALGKTHFLEADIHFVMYTFL